MTERIELGEITKNGEFLLPQSQDSDLIPVKNESEQQSIKNEHLGMIFACVAVVCRAFGQCYTKYIQKTFPNDFHTVPFLFLRSFMIVTLSLVHTYFAGVRILTPKEIPFKKWFFYRTNMNFFGMSFMTMALWYLRASTAQIIHSLHPIIVIILSYFILKEKYYPRYVIGICFCLVGSSFIVLNEHKAQTGASDNNINDHLGHTLKGLLLVSFSMLNVSIVTISNKILASNKVPVNTQMIYVGLTTMTYSFIFILIFGGVVFKPGYLFMCMLHGIFFYLANVTYNKALQIAPVSKIILITYLQIVFVFIIAHFLLNESIFFTDILGAAIMFSYMVYNALYPIKDNKK